MTVKIDEDKILNLIGTGIVNIINSDEVYKKYTFELTNELQYVNKKKEENPHKIFLVVKLLPATLNFGQTLLPIIIDAVAEKNKLDITRRLLMSFAEMYNLEWNSDQTIKQYYTTPVVLANFQEIGNGYRSLVTMSGTLQICEDANFYTLTYNYTEDEQAKTESVPMITSGLSFNNQLDTQSFYDTSNITKSKARVGTLVVNFSLYFVNNKLLKKVLDVMTKAISNNTDFNFTIAFKNGTTMSSVLMKLASFSLEENIGEIPVCNLTFTN